MSKYSGHSARAIDQLHRAVGGHGAARAPRALSVPVELPMVADSERDEARRRETDCERRALINENITRDRSGGGL